MLERVSAWTGLVALGALALALDCSDAKAADPAVSDTNFKLNFFGGRASADGLEANLGGLAGSLAIPAGYAFGIQLDGALGKVDSNGFYAAGGHFFWRDPGQGMFGLYAGYAKLDAFGGQTVKRLGVEAERFIGNLTLRGAVGVRDSATGASTYGNAKLDYYWTPNLKTSSGVAYEGQTFYSSNAEYQFVSDDTAGMSLYYESNYRSNDNYQVLGGLKITFGKSMSLIDRHRRQDPDLMLGVDLIATEQAVARFCPFGVSLPLPQSCECPPDSFSQPGAGANTFQCHEAMK